MAYLGVELTRQRNGDSYPARALTDDDEACPMIGGPAAPSSRIMDHYPTRSIHFGKA